MNILLIEDEKKIASFIRKGLREQSYNVDVSYDGIKGQHLAEMNDYDVIVLDIMLPGQDGWKTCNNIREAGIKTPVLMLTSLGQTEDKVRGLNMGADDYLSKPFEFREFLARVRALERRSGRSEKQSVLKIDDLILDAAEHTVIRNNAEISLTAKEFALLEFL